MPQRLLKLPIFTYLKSYVWVIVVVSLVASHAWVGASSYKFGKETGAQEVQVVLERERVEHTTAYLTATKSALQQSETRAQEAREQQAKDLAAALAASEERQAIRVSSAVRQAALEASTRAPGTAYVDPRCVLDPDTYERLQGALK